jgi:hypothetical protein
MPMPWPPMAYVEGDSDPRSAQVKAALDALGAHVDAGLSAAGLAPSASLLWQPWHLAVVWDAQTTWCAFSPNTGGTPEIEYFDRPSLTITDGNVIAARVGNGTNRGRLTSCWTGGTNW